MDERALIQALAEAVEAAGPFADAETFDKTALRERVRLAAHENDMEGVIGLELEDEWYAVLIDGRVPPAEWPQLRRAVFARHVPPPSGSFTDGAGRSTDPREWNDYLVDGDGACLANRPGYSDPNTLSVWERLATIDAAARDWPAAAREISAAGLRAIHRHLFGEVFAWAGRYRTVGIRKGTTDFASPDAVGSRMDELFEQIALVGGTDLLAPSDELLVTRTGDTLPTDPFTERLAPLFAELNAIHPFREGNGRTQRAMVSLVAERAGHSIDWSATTGERMVDASICAAADDLDALKHLLIDCTGPESARRLRAVIGAFGRSYPTTELHGMTFRTLRPGETVDGRVAIAGAPFAAVVHEAGTIVIADNDAVSDVDASMGQPVRLRS